jgi:hypothetical protein
MKKVRVLALATVGVLFLSSLVFAQGGNKYVGVDKCKLCHRSESKGNQYGQWMKAKHSTAYDTLAGEKAKQVAAGLGIEDPQKSERCLKCHSTAFGVPEDMITSGSKLKLEDGVQCESCHGPGEKYWKITIMKDHDKSVANGLVEISEAVCVKCHNEENPVFEGFNYEEKYEIVAHPMPK